ncbi:MAG: acetylornithine deacetylase/succinyl-diaminopimelate desuccinylase-like protein [Ascidiaceihabitans sp.]|jgi:acetylornithine deacetylase/succinyl-diaminopimelate desuccinylase-like protein
MGKAAATTAAALYFDSGQFQTELAAMVAHPTTSQVADAIGRLNIYPSDQIKPRLKAMGFDMAIHDNPDPSGGPFLTAIRIEDAHKPIVLIYGHGDVTHGQSGAWANGMNPFDLTEDGDRLYGRGTADNKGQHLINIAALEAVLRTRGALGFNVKIVIEMSEEIGSPGLGAFFETHKELLSADVLIASDGPRLQPDTPTIFMGSRGAIDFDLTVDLRNGAHHSGNWGGLLADPAQILSHAISTICDARGQLQIEAWKPTSLTPAVRAALDGLPILSDAGPQIDPEWGEASLTPTERAYAWNSFAVLAMNSGDIDAPQNAINGIATARCQLRFVVGTNVDQIVPALRKHLCENGFETVQVSEQMGGFQATRLDPNHPWVTRVAASITDTTGQTPHILPNLAGSLPNACFTEILGLPTVWIPHSYRGCSQHAPNEHVLKSTCRDALILMAGLWYDIGKTG